jgi:hypothetical protein
MSVRTVSPPARIAYWASTLLFVLLLGVSGVTYLFAVPANVDGIVHLGYPLYVMKFIGVAKILGAIAIIVDRYPTLKEWAYAGFSFDLLLACYSHLASGDGLRASFPLIMLAVMFVSYVQWKRGGVAV